jgi:geranylgeranyl reductase family protein
MIRLLTNTDLTSDVIIAGAGPAGSSAAYYLSCAGFRVFLLDKNAFPRDKTCGDFVGPLTLKELENMGVDTITGFKETNIIRQAALHLDAKEAICQKIPLIDKTYNFGRVIPRKKLDSWILRRAIEAGSAVLFNHEVTGAETDQRCVNVKVTTAHGLKNLKAKLFIAADGSNSIIGRQLYRNNEWHKNRGIALRAYFQNVEGPDDRTDLFFNSKTFPGYYWLFPCGKGLANVGIGMAGHAFPPIEKNLQQLFIELVKNDSALNSRLRNASIVGRIQGWPLATHYPSQPVISNRIMLVGDAAGLINPINGEGVQTALQSGRLAAATAVKCLIENNCSISGLEHYAESLRSELKVDMTVAHMIIQLIRNRAVNPLWLNLLRTIVAQANLDESYAQITGGVLAGILPMREVISPKVILRSIGQTALSGIQDGITNIVHGPKQMVTTGMEALSSTCNMVSTVFSHPVSMAQWGLGSCVQASRLVSQMVEENIPVVGNKNR